MKDALGRFARGDDPHAVLALKRTTEFEEYAEEDEAMLEEFKDWLKSQANTPDAVRARRFLAEYEETQDDENRLKQFQDWLKAKGHDVNALVTLWWSVEFEEAEE